MKSLVLAAGLMASFASMAHAEAETYTLDPSHSQIVFDYNHLGFSTTTSMFSGFEGTIEFDAQDPAKSSVSVEFPAESLITGWDARTKHFMTDDFFGAAENPEITFKSTSIEVTGEKTGKITGDLTVNGVTKPITIDATMTQMGEHPMQKKPWVGFDGTTTIKRSDFDMGMYAPYVSDDVNVRISIEAMKGTAE
ncbi:YceI family protein [Thioclava sp. GXIMD4216]|uniref:YceI family protein n=1 Tax=unclassified Thioclava TaxID=2621713 RepID=UPI0030D2D54C